MDVQQHRPHRPAGPEHPRGQRTGRAGNVRTTGVRPSSTSGLYTVRTDLGELKHYEFNAHRVEPDQRYASRPVLGDGLEPAAATRDPELYHRPSTEPGAKLPHVWLVGSHGRRVSTLDLVGHGRFTVLTGLSGLD
ncbi:hypothetical protein [Amycolatopsis sp. H20-H5]|uniref:hypothetical protein n=1 Tax=Amycolatopsis sp. H20-H5 TaxID=3046309 RepID=UPI002DB9A3A7|nr:hypothetical protein [Amycolatopsis sp. H20-H5]MEC3977008.1 hypothetical protein [Amycolatopsis sp. H20-H5]